MSVNKTKNNQFNFYTLLLLFLIPIFSGYITNTTNLVEFNQQKPNIISDLSAESILDDEKSINLQVSIPDIIIKDGFMHSGQKFHQITIEDGGNLADVGNPRIPFKTVKILLPYGKNVDTINVIKGKDISIEGNFNIEPAQKQVPIGSFEEPEFIFNEEIYQTEQLYPEKIFEIVSISEFRGYKILILNLFPVSYIPKTGEISYVNEMTVQVELKSETNANIYYRCLTKDEVEVVDIVDNPSVIDTYRGKSTSDQNFNSPLALPPGSYDYVIITSQNLKNSAGKYTFQDLAAYKNALGIQTNIVTTEYIYTNYIGNDNPEKIRNFIIDAYQNWGIEYVLLGADGDAVYLGGESGDDIIPSRGLYATAYGEIDYNITSDLYYAALDGDWNTDGDDMWGEPGEDDLYAEIYVGRAPVDSENELSNFINKTLIHEEEKHPYLSKALMVGEDLGWYVWGADYKDEVMNGSDANGYSTVGFPDSLFVDTLYDRDLDPNRWDKDDLIPLINDGVHIINHLGHCDVEYSMKMVNYDVDKFSNNHYFFGYSQGCYNGAFDNKGPWGQTHENDSIVEHFITTPHGAFAFVGNSRFGWGDPYGTNGASQYYDRQFFDAIFYEGIEEIGRVNQDSKEDNIGYISQDAMRWCYYQLNLFGDPTAKLKPQPNDFEPELIQGEVSPTVGDQTTLFTFTVNYTDVDNNPPIYVNLLINGITYSMEKQNQNDNNYTNGCVYQKSLYLQPDTYSYFFECSDNKHTDYTETYYGPTVNEKLNENSPILNHGQVNPNIGLADLTNFAFEVNYTDLDNNAPSYIQVTINTTVFDMYKQDPFDTNVMDGCIYIYETSLTEIGTYTYWFNCSDGSSLASNGPFSGPTVKICQIFDGMYIYHNLTFSFGTFYDSAFSYSYDSGTLFNINWDVLPYQGSWKENVLTRIISDTQGNAYFGDGVHTPVWIFKNVSIGDEIAIGVMGDGDHIFNITGETTQFIAGFGELGVWILEDLTEPGGYAWYEKSTGILLTGIFKYYGGSYNYTFDFVDTNAKFTYPINDYQPSLTMETLTPKVGEQSTLLNFSIIYTDLDNNMPNYIYTVINNTSYSMEKYNPYDENYRDGCIYQCLTYLQSAPYNYSYYFECNDGKFSDSTKVNNDLEIHYSNSHTPSLSNGQVNPTIGYNCSTVFTYSVIYSDVDNNAPVTITVTIGSDVYSMTRQNPADNNYMDGCVYKLNTILSEVGTYTYSFSCSDGEFTASNGPYSGPIVEEEPILPDVFELSSDADNPDDDGVFILFWAESEGAINYSVYQHSSYINDININITLLENGMTNLTIALDGYEDGTYFFTIVAYNKFGSILSNCLEIIVRKPRAGVPGYDLLFLIGVISIIMLTITIKKHKNIKKQ